jgi:hypothetical protein
MVSLLRIQKVRDFLQLRTAYLEIKRNKPHQLPHPFSVPLRKLSPMSNMLHASTCFFIIVVFSNSPAVMNRNKPLHILVPFALWLIKKYDLIDKIRVKNTQFISVK